MKSGVRKPHGFTAIELLMEWIVPIIGAVLTVDLLHRFGCRSGWWLWLVLPGALVFQWAFAWVLMAIGRFLRPRGRPDRRL